MTGEPWPSFVDLVSNEQKGAAVTTDHTSWDDLDRTVVKVARSGIRVEVWATVIGQLRAGTKSPVGPCDRVAGGHYRHLGMFPAQLIVRGISDVSVFENPTSEYDYSVYINPKLRRMK